MKFPYASFLLLFLLSGCRHEDPPRTNPQFAGDDRVWISGYDADVMEPFISYDGNYLLFNNSNDPSVNTNLHWATRTDDTHFIYQGEITGANTTSLDAVASMDQHGKLYFISTRSYFNTLTSIFRGDFIGGAATQVTVVNGPSKLQSGWLNFDAEISHSGEILYFVDGRFDANGGPYEADITMAAQAGSGFQRTGNAQDILKNVNTPALEYAPCTSGDQLELYFTRVDAPLTIASVTQIYVAVRKSITEPFGQPVPLGALTGFVEAPTITGDGKRLYFHRRKADGKFAAYLTRRLL